MELCWDTGLLHSFNVSKVSLYVRVHICIQYNV